MADTPESDVVKQVVACAFAGIMMTKIDLRSYDAGQVSNLISNVAARSCDLAEALDQEFKRRGWGK